MATPLTDENAAQFLQPVVDDILGQVRGLVDPLRTEVAALKGTAAPPQEPTAPTPAATPTQVKEPSAGTIPEGVDFTDPKSIAAHRAKLEAQAVDWNDPAAVEAYQTKLQGEASNDGGDSGSEDPTPSGDPAVEAQKAQLQKEIEQLEARKAQLSRGSNQGGNDSRLPVTANKGPEKIDSFEAGHLLADHINALNGHKKEA